MIKIYRQGEKLIPVILCDHCQQRIEEAGLAAVLTTDPTLRDGGMCDVAHAHKGDCHDALDRRYQVPGASVGWDEMSHHLLNLTANVNLDPAQMQGLRTRIDEAGF